jgi:2,3-bisphosphoglycerate-independent phosphoglycerate mutase
VVDVLVILDGASEPLRGAGGAPTSLERARTPVLDRLASEGVLTRLRTVAPWLAAGSESAIPALLGWTPPSPVDRGAVEAAAWGIGVSEGQRAWRIDVLAPGLGRPSEARVAHAAAEIRAAALVHAVHRLGGHRLLLIGPVPLPDAARAPGLRAWPQGILPPPILDADTVVVGARGAAIGIARLMGAATVVPDGATGLPGSDLCAKAAAALDAIAAGAARVVVHVGGADEAAHLRDRAAKVAAIERADRDLLAPLHAALRAAGGTLRVCPDHGCDPSTGEHGAEPVPSVSWSAGNAPARARRLTERAVASLPIAELASAGTLAVA